jgi:diguanylate cyclase (GGDEF)-like protein/putative nucleotidyltransferase with HDIG domain
MLAGTISGVLYLIGGVTLAAFDVLPGVTRTHWVALLVLGLIGASWGLCSLVAIDWERVPSWTIHVSHSAGFVIIALAVASSGGEQSPGWIYLFFSAVFGAYFYRRPAVTLYLVGCVVVQALPVAYDPRALHDGFLAQLAIAGPAYLVLGYTIVAGKTWMWTLRVRAERLAAEQGALRRVATSVVGGEPAHKIYDLVAFEAAGLLDSGAAAILRLDGPDSATVTGSWADRPSGRYLPGTVLPVTPGGDIWRAVRTGRPARVHEHPHESTVARLGYRSSIVAPIHVAGSTWGALAVTAAAPSHFRAEDDERLMEFGDLLATAIASIDDRARLAAQALSDPLTGLANHRSLQRRLAAEVARASRHGTPLSVAVLDIDHFKQVNDSGGHDIGDELLARVADCLSSLARAEDTLGRAGGDEFAWILPETGRDRALVAIERARRMIAATAPPPYRITVSAGICDTTVTQDPAELLRLADGALYWSKAHGRDQCSVYDPAVINELSAHERAERLERSQAMVGLRALARAIDAKDPATRRHSERVAELAGKLARAVGWSPERAQLLSEAALVHDVGKIGVPDSVLFKAAHLTAAEREQVCGHAELAARIVEDVLLPEQVDWIRTHHERPDGRGYPRGLRGAQIPEGAALLAAADAWDVMTGSRSYSVPKPVETALAECISLVGRQFTKTAVGALVQLHSAGELENRDALVEAAA